MTNDSNAVEESVRGRGYPMEEGITLISLLPTGIHVGAVSQSKCSLSPGDVIFNPG